MTTMLEQAADWLVLHPDSRKNQNPNNQDGPVHEL